MSKLIDCNIGAKTLLSTLSRTLATNISNKHLLQQASTVFLALLKQEEMESVIMSCQNEMIMVSANVLSELLSIYPSVNATNWDQWLPCLQWIKYVIRWYKKEAYDMLEGSLLKV